MYCTFLLILTLDCPAPVQLVKPELMAWSVLRIVGCARTTPRAITSPASVMAAVNQDSQVPTAQNVRHLIARAHLELTRYSAEYGSVAYSIHVFYLDFVCLFVYFLFLVFVSFVVVVVGGFFLLGFFGCFCCCFFFPVYFVHSFSVDFCLCPLCLLASSVY